MSDENLCCICNKKISGLFPAPLQKGSHKRICNTCYYLLNDLKGPTDTAGFEEKFNTLVEYVKDINAPETKDVIQNILVKVSEGNWKPAGNENLVKVESHLATTGFSFEGYSILSYLGIVSGECVLGTGFMSEFAASLSDLTGSQSNAFALKLEEAKNIALKNLIYRSVEKSGNAIIGVGFDYMTFSNNIIGVIANGTSVIVKKINMETEN